MTADGGRGVIEGPHKVFTEIHEGYFTTNQAFFINREESHKYDVQLLGYHTDHSKDIPESQVNLTIQQRLFEQAESTGCEITYRCHVNMSTCQECKNHEKYESISLKEEVEQHIIDQSVTVNLEESIHSQNSNTHRHQQDV